MFDSRWGLNVFSFPLAPSEMLNITPFLKEMIIISRFVAIKINDNPENGKG